jgi:hypothetical protein
VDEIFGRERWSAGWKWESGKCWNGLWGEHGFGPQLLSLVASVNGLVASERTLSVSSKITVDLYVLRKSPDPTLWHGRQERSNL